MPGLPEKASSHNKKRAFMIEAKRRKKSWRPLAGAAIVISVAAIAGQSVLASLNATAFNTTYFQSNIKSETLSTGIQIHKNITLNNGVLRPNLNFQYAHNYQGNINQNTYYSSTDTSTINFKTTPSDYITAGFGLGYQSFKNTLIDFKYNYSQGSSSYRSNALTAHISSTF